MRKILLLAGVLALSAACGGKKASEPAGDCVASVDNAMSLSKDDFKKSNVDDATIPKIRDASIQRCKEDKWSGGVLKCLADAKKSDDVVKCQQAMTKQQNENMAKAITDAMATQPQPDQGSGGSADTGSAGSAGSAAEAGGSGSSAPAIAGLPPECSQYQAMIEKLSACDKLPAASRDLMKKSFETTAKTWKDLDKLPDSAKTALVNGCKQGADALAKAAGPTCGF